MKWTILLLIILLVGCDKPEDPEYFQEEFADITEPAYLKCKISTLNYYTDGLLIYHINDAGSKIVYSPIGEYMKPANYTRWQLRLFKDKKDSVYNKTWAYIINRQLPNEEEFTCESITKFPTVFSGFIKTHPMLYKDFKRPEVIEFD